MKQEVIEVLKNIVGEDWVLTSLDQTQGYLYDETEALIRPKAAEDCVVVKPGTPEEIAQILKYANEVLVPVVPRGGGTGLCGAAIPTQTSIILSDERLNKILEIDEENLMVTCESGVTLAALLEKLHDYDNLFFPVHPGDEGAHIGGMAVENAGGAGAVKHGIMRNQIKGLQVVLPTGEIVNLGGKLIKNNTGLDLLHLMIGSEGILGIVTKVTLKLYPEPKHKGTLLVSFDNRKDAIAVVPKILQQGITPLAIEYMERDIALESAAHIGEKWPAEEGSVDVMIILSEDKEEELYEKSEVIVDLCENHNAVYTLIAETAKEQRSILAIRSNVYTAVVHDAADALDMAVPVGSIPDFMNDIFALADKYGARTPAVGHAGDGNIHNFIMRENGEIPSYYEALKEAMYKTAVKYGGTITAEHGVGKTRMANLNLQLSEKEIELIKGIKKAFDPNGILNPGTVVTI
ncbi:FAD-binding oxidoreductase [Clostridium formicaceticum]|jgi:glycolate oxidase|uniref:FAD-binding protein n=1 Tax=Clostridium formicaceticum TaxID=1497 RepID=A0AAC9RG17_9CLOT|nr:FAD-binding oxidoreductase [Clostridium formicaceticum]AOY75778.1 FAD-binding protein [Clostridium formicaceticum]ARE86104.1 putative FAD-linked oxidoreductase [Clostridium formicaceticum]